jgi:hypothetical protein
MIFVGIDPGMSGAIALYDPDKDWLEVHDCPTVSPNGKNEMFLPAVIDILRPVQVASCIIERAQAMFGYGMGYGSYLGVLASLKIPHSKISPVEWKRKLRVPKDKDGARARASELMPAHSGNWMLKKHHGRAESALLAYYAAHNPQ